jgi:hypothetical protein
MRYYVCRASRGNFRKQLTAYFFSALGFRGLEYLSFLLVHTVVGVDYLIVIVLITGLSFVGKFFYYRNVIFGENRKGDLNSKTL